MTTYLLSVALVTFAAVAQASSQPPVPRAGESKRQPPKGQAATNQQQAQPVERGSEQLPAVVRVLPAPKTQEETATEERQRESEAATKRWTIWLTALTVFVGVGQWYVIRRQNEIMDTQTALMEGQLVATKQAADAATDSAVTAKNALHTTERAYLRFGLYGFRPVPIGRPPEMFIGLRTGLPVVVNIQMSNVGRTPAHNVDVVIRGLIAGAAPTDPNYEEGFGVTFQAGALPRSVSPGETMVIIRAHADPLTDEQFKGLRSGALRLFYWAKVTYEDSFGRAHVSRDAGLFSGAVGEFVMLDNPRYFESS